MNAEFATVFARLREILRQNAGGLAVTEDAARRFCLEGGRHPQHKIPMAIAWVQIGKGYVSFHHMGVYAFPQLVRDLSPALKARMQGKSCFNFKVADEALFRELAALTVRAFAAARQAGLAD